MKNNKNIQSFREFNENSKRTFVEYLEDIAEELNKRFVLTTKEIDEIFEYYMDDLEYGFFEGNDGYVDVKKIVDSFVVDGKLKWKIH